MIIYITTFIAESLILWWYCSSMFNSKYSKTLEFYIIFSGYGFLFFISLLKSIWLNNIFFSIINFTILLALYNTKWNIALFHSIVITCIMGLSEMLIAGFSSQFTETVLYIQSDIQFQIILSILSKMIYFICLRIMRTLVRDSRDEIGYTNKATTLLNIIPFISLYIIIVLTTILLNTHISNYFRYMVSSCSVLLLFINILIFYIHHYTLQKNRDFTELQVQLQKEYDMTEYYKTLFAQNENQQILIHDIRKHLMSISQFNEQNEHDKIRNYLDTLLNSSDLQYSVHVSDNDLLNSILCHYINLCQEKHILFKVDVRKKVLQNFDYSDLTALFCNLLDNAMEACSGILDSYIELSITEKENTNITVINIINTCRTCPNFNKNGLPISQKKNKFKHGLGLKSILRIVEKHDGNIKMYYEDERIAFHTIIMVRSHNDTI